MGAVEEPLEQPERSKLKARGFWSQNYHLFITYMCDARYKKGWPMDVRHHCQTNLNGK